jgi:hypothetical protein
MMSSALFSGVLVRVPFDPLLSRTVALSAFNPLHGLLTAEYDGYS